MARLALVPVAVLAMAIAGQTAAQAAPAEQAAAAPSVTVTPSTGLTDGQRVTVAVTGLTPEAAVGQCTYAEEGPVCNPGSWVQFRTNDGNGSTTVPVRQSFEGYTVAEDGTFAYWGTVDCTRLACVVGATDGVSVVFAALAFR